ncbi:MAG: MmcQ/YjbR family DNA-binding protein [Bacilli bacterium]|nr:MmcQ/YjbR family DNA-binding protein [Bacilli bacterium]
MLEDSLFKNYYPYYNKLLEYGFKKKGVYYLFEKKINDLFIVEIKVDSNFKVKGKIFDMDTEEEYTNFRVEDSLGTFSGTIRQNFIDLLIDIRNNCFYKKTFLSEQANRISLLIKKKYGDSPIFKWDKYPTLGVFQNKDTNKWYALVMDIAGEKFNLNIGNVTAMNVKLDVNEIPSLLKKKGFYPAYHMNKKYWISVLLDDSISDEVIMELIDESYQFSKKK